MILPLLALIGQAAPPAVDGTLLRPGSACYTIARGETPLGVTFQKIVATAVDGAPAWDIVVHQKVGSFDLRDHFVLRQKDLAPIAFDSRRDGTEHVRVDYRGDALVMTRFGTLPQSVPLSGPVWEGNLWGLTMAALPLEEGAKFAIPFYHYDKGLGSFAFDVVGSEPVDGRDAWIVEASAGDGRKVRYRIAKDDRAELGYSGGGFAQRPGGDCAAIAE